MVAKITSPDNCQRAVDYIMAIHKEDKETKLLFHSDGVLPTDNNTIAACMEAAALYKDHDLEKPFRHISLDFHKYDKDRLTDDFMIQVAKDYMKEMGYTNTEFVAYRHFDKEHPHCHILISRVNRDGEVISDSREWERNIDICKKLNQKYALHMSNGKVAVNKDRLKGKEKLKTELMDKVKMARDKATDWKEFEAQLKSQGISLKFHYNNVTRQLMGVAFSDGSISCGGKKLDPSLTYTELAKSFGDIHQLAHDNVKYLYEAKREALLWDNPSSAAANINKAFPDFDVQYPLEHAMSHLPNAYSLMTQYRSNMTEYVDYNPDEYISTDDLQTCYIPLGLMVAVALAPLLTPIAQCSSGGGGGSSDSRGYKDDDDDERWKFRFRYKPSRTAYRKPTFKR